MFVADKHAGWCGYCNLYGSHFIGCPVAPEDPDDYYGTDDDYEDEDEEEDYEGDEDEGYPMSFFMNTCHFRPLP